jgi:hypothetical protein
MRYGSKSHAKLLRPCFALLLLVVFAELSSLTFAQLRTDCPYSTSTASGSQLNFYLNATASPNGQCTYINSSTPLQPGDVVPGCYSGTEQSSGYTLNALTSCTVCAEGQSGCYVFLPPPNPITPTVDPSLLPPPPTFPVPTFPPILPGEPPPPPIYAYYWDPFDPWYPSDDDDPWWHWHGCLGD